LFTVPVPGFSFDAQTFGRTPDHGISLSPNERELYLIDTPNGYVHVFDVSGLPAVPPRDIADIKLAHPPPNDGWLQHSRNGRYVYVGRAGDVIDTRSRKVVAFLAPLQGTADFLEIDWRNGRPIATTSRYGVGYIRSQERSGQGHRRLHVRLRAEVATPFLADWELSRARPLRRGAVAVFRDLSIGRSPRF